VNLYKKYDYLWEVVCSTLNSLVSLIAEPSDVMNLDEMISFLTGCLDREHKAHDVSLYTAREKIKIIGNFPVGKFRQVAQDSRRRSLHPTENNVTFDHLPRHRLDEHILAHIGDVATSLK
jgi:hypothetical protein